MQRISRPTDNDSHLIEWSMKEESIRIDVFEQNKQEENVYLAQNKTTINNRERGEKQAQYLLSTAAAYMSKYWRRRRQLPTDHLHLNSFS